jgi:hypothetical protein
MINQHDIFFFFVREQLEDDVFLKSDDMNFRENDNDAT